MLAEITLQVEADMQVHGMYIWSAHSASLVDRGFCEVEGMFISVFMFAW